MSKVQVNLEYPYSYEYSFETTLERINLDEERMRDIISGNGFVIGPPRGIKKDLKDPDGIFSSKYGQTLKDLNPYSDRYRCECGHTTFSINNGSICPICHTQTKFVDDNFEYFGWKLLKEPHFIIHPALYKTVEAFIGKDRLDHIIAHIEQKDADGNIKEVPDLPKEAETEPFYGIGMMKFRERFDEIIAYYNKQYNSPTKRNYHGDILKEREKIFCSSIPVFTFLLRPVDIDQNNFCHEDTNDNYVMINRLASSLNKYDDLVMQKTSAAPRDKLLYGLQTNVNELYSKIDKILQRKKGVIRALLSGRYNFSSRSVITPNPDLRIDEITLPYKSLTEILQQRIINILRRTYNISGSDAYNIWYKASITPDPIVVNIIQTIIKSSGNGRGLPFIINRNPTIAYGGILQMFCVGINYNYTMGIPLQILPLLAADFDKHSTYQVEYSPVMQECSTVSLLIVWKGLMLN